MFLKNIKAMVLLNSKKINKKKIDISVEFFFHKISNKFIKNFHLLLMFSKYYSIYKSFPNITNPTKVFSIGLVKKQKYSFQFKQL